MRKIYATKGVVYGGLSRLECTFWVLDLGLRVECFRTWALGLGFGGEGVGF